MAKQFRFGKLNHNQIRQISGMKLRDGSGYDKKYPCKNCQLRPRRNGSAYCKQCSHNN